MFGDVKNQVIVEARGKKDYSPKTKHAVAYKKRAGMSKNKKDDRASTKTGLKAPALRCSTTNLVDSSAIYGAADSRYHNKTTVKKQAKNEGANTLSGQKNAVDKSISDRF